MSQNNYRYRSLHAFLDMLIGFLPSRHAPEGHQSLHSSPQKILVLKFGGMGEAVLAGSLLTTLKDRHPSLQIDFLMEDRVAGVVNASGTGKVYSYLPRKDGFWKAVGILRQVRKSGYDAVIDFEQQSLLTALFVRMTAIPVRLGFSPPLPSPRTRMYTHLIQLRESESMWRLFVRLVRILDSEIPESLQTVPLPFSKPKSDWVKNWLLAHRVDSPAIPLVSIHLGVGPSAQYRRWPMERFFELVSTLTEQFPDMILIFTGSKEERALIRRFGDNFQGRCIDASGLENIQQTAALLRQCDLLISADTGIMHLAAAMGTPTVGLFGPNTPDCWAPVGPRATYVYSTHQKCSPCINSYKRKIPEKCFASQESACMWDISVEEVLQAAANVVDPSRLGLVFSQSSSMGPRISSAP